jgi:hypothetical protein
MMRFRFRLEKILSWIRLRETTKKMEFATTLQRTEFLKKRKQAVQESIFSACENPTEGSYIDLGLSLVQSEKLKFDREEILRLEILIRKEEETLEKKRSELAKLAMRRRGLENLKDKRYREFRLIEVRKDQKRLDENYQILKVKRS